ncbi:MAG: TIGR03745 family integrating conjugative element membrane protein [Gammaproteobacteria bacterium]|nr:TIGR03745 family integrating conjugative element membrane protein [Gammaproteobacteria bacterium]
MTTVRSLFSRARAHTQPRGFAALAAAGLVPAQAMAQGLPTMEAPSRGEGGGLIETLQNYLYDFGALGGLILATVAFIIVAIASIATFNEARVRGEWSKFGVVVVVGVVLIVAIIWLATKAAEIL